MSEAGNTWPATVLDACGVEIAFVNAPRLGVGRESARFRWVPFADPLLAPLKWRLPRRTLIAGNIKIEPTVPLAELGERGTDLESTLSTCGLLQGPGDYGVTH
jgi:hypothetical protein